jgi:peptidoglycan/LPS O-acetylase OafA/YrhL
VLAAAFVELAEAVLILVTALWAGIATATGNSYQTSSGVAITIIGVATAFVLALVARGLRRARRWSRTPAMLTQLFTGIVAVYLLQSARLEWGIPTIVLAVAGLAALLAPASLNVLTPGRTQKG